MPPLPEGGSFDPETLEGLKKALSEAWASLLPDQQVRTSQIELAERILRAAASRERDPRRLRTAAVIGLVHGKPSSG